jgi:hypothetical protein
MKISRELAMRILKYCRKHKDFYFPFLVICKKRNGQTFELRENLQDLREGTTELLAKGFIEKIVGFSFEKDVYELAKKYRTQWKEELWESENIEEFGLNEFLGGKAEGFEECLQLIRKYRAVPDFENSIFIKYEK